MKAIEGIETEEEKAGSEINKRLAEAEAIFATGAYESAIVSAYIALERAVRNRVKDDTLPLNVLVRRLVDEAAHIESTHKPFMVVTDLRNRAAHTGERISKHQAQETLNSLKDIIAEIAPE